MDMRFTLPVKRALLRAGWEEGRRVTLLVDQWERRLTEEFGPMHALARDALAEFGGLQFSLDGAGIDKALEPFRLDPVLVEGEADRLDAFARFTGSLYPIGDFGHGAFLIAMAADGQVYVLEQDIQRVGLTMVDALDRLVLGRQMDPVGPDA